MKTFVVIPTYNEAKNIGRLIKLIYRYAPSVRVVVVDDNSPDGTASVVETLRAVCPKKLHLLKRCNTRGRGSAGVAGFLYALKKGAEVIIEMDADLSHHPRHLPAMIKAIESSDLVIGSRLIKGGKDNRGALRQLITRLANLYIRAVMGFSVKDSTSGYRAYEAELVRLMEIEKMISDGPAILQEMLFQAGKNNATIVEIPIVFIDRQKGSSKFDLKVIIKGLISPWKIKRAYEKLLPA